MLLGFSRTIAPTRKLALYTSHTGSSDSPRQVAPEDLSAQPIKQKEGGQAGNYRGERLQGWGQGAAGAACRVEKAQRLGLICLTSRSVGMAIDLQVVYHTGASREACEWPASRSP